MFTVTVVPEFACPTTSKYPGNVRLVNWFPASFNCAALRKFNPFWAPSVLLSPSYTRGVRARLSRNHL